MELKEFIKATITAVAESIEELNEDKNLVKKAIVNPKELNPLGDKTQSDKLIYRIERGLGEDTSQRIIQDIKFNLAVTEAEETGKDGGVRLKVVDFSMNNKTELKNVNMVKFFIPVAFLK